MAFKDSLRLEQIYFQKLKDMIKTCKAWYDGENTDKDRDILEALIQACAAILLLYRNLGEEWNELTALIQRTMHDLVDLKDKTDAYHDELNEKIDEVNNYLNAAIMNIEAQIDAFGGLPSNANANEGDVLTVGANGVNEWREGGGTIPTYVINITQDDSTPPKIVFADNKITDAEGNILSKTFDEIFTEYFNNKAVIKLGFSGSGISIGYSNWLIDVFAFRRLNGIGGTEYVCVFEYTAEITVAKASEVDVLNSTYVTNIDLYKLLQIRKDFDTGEYIIDWFDSGEEFGYYPLIVKRSST